MKDIQKIIEDINALEVKSVEAVKLAEEIVELTDKLQKALEKFDKLPEIDVDHMIKTVAHNSEQ